MPDLRNLWWLGGLLALLIFMSGQGQAQAGFDFGQTWSGLSAAKQQLLLVAAAGFTVLVFVAYQFEK